MKSKKKSSKPEGRSDRSIPSGQKLMRGYTRARFTNAQGERDEVLLFDPQSEESEWLVAQEDNAGLRFDIRKALEGFSLQERRVLQAVLVQNKPMTMVVQKLRLRKHPVWWWREWLRTQALPTLRKRLADYKENGKVVV